MTHKAFSIPLSDTDLQTELNIAINIGITNKFSVETTKKLAYKKESN